MVPSVEFVLMLPIALQTECTRKGRKSAHCRLSQSTYVSARRMPKRFTQNQADMRQSLSYCAIDCSKVSGILGKIEVNGPGVGWLQYSRKSMKTNTKFNTQRDGLILSPNRSMADQLHSLYPKGKPADRVR
jgi:hypothetical protein